MVKNDVYMQWMMKGYNKRVHDRDFQIRDMVLRKVILSTRNPIDGKLNSNYKGPYIVNKLRKNGTYELIRYQYRKILKLGMLKT